MLCFSVRRTTRCLLCCAGLLVALGIGAVFLERFTFENVWLDEVRASLVRLFSLDGEANVPAWFSSLLLATSALLAGAHAALARESRARVKWAAFALVLIAMSMDEAAAIHEMSLKPIRAAFHPMGLLHYAWIVPGAAVVLAAARYFGGFVLTLERPTRRRLVLGVCIYFAGALGVEAVQGWMLELHGHGLAYGIAGVVEEAMEMSGAVVLISSLLLHARFVPGSVQVQVSDEGTESAVVVSQGRTEVVGGP